jgi:hypothetical protein
VANPHNTSGGDRPADTVNRSTDTVYRPNRDEFEALRTAQEAGTAVGESIGRWWNELGVAADSLMARTSLDDLFRHALATMREALATDAVSVLLANDEEDELIARASVGLGEEVSLEL